MIFEYQNQTSTSYINTITHLFIIFSLLQHSKTVKSVIYRVSSVYGVPKWVQKSFHLLELGIKKFNYSWNNFNNYKNIRAKVKYSVNCIILKRKKKKIKDIMILCIALVQGT